MNGKLSRGVAALALLAAVAAPGAVQANRDAILAALKASGQAAPASAAFEDGVAAVDAGQYEAAIEKFQAVVEAEPGNAGAYTYLGYIHRQLQDFDQAFAHYQRALDLDPDHTGAHEYIGEAYLETGNLAMAEKHLEALDLICLFGCQDYEDLKAAVELYRANQAG